MGDVVVGVIDTGVLSESRSFIDKGFGLPPRTWKGKCEEGKNFTALHCNRKLIGARFFVKGYEEEMSPIYETKNLRDHVFGGKIVVSFFRQKITKSLFQLKIFFILMT